jgi:serine/threonine protein kinase
LENEIINSTLNFPIKKTLGILKHLSAALGYVHQKGFVYCDIKPSNIISRYQKYTLIDFGLVRPKGMEVSGGTIGYMPPEVLQSENGHVPANPNMDIYSLGILLYELLTGFHPFASKKIYHLNRHYSFDTQSITNKSVIPSSASSLNPLLPAVFDKLLLKCVDKNPGNRYQDMESLYLDFKAAAERAISTRKN